MSIADFYGQAFEDALRIEVASLQAEYHDKPRLVESIAMANGIFLAGHLHVSADGEYAEVQSSGPGPDGEDVWYVVSGSCTCPAALKGGRNCKHRMAWRLWQLVQARLAAPHAGTLAEESEAEEDLRVEVASEDFPAGEADALPPLPPTFPEAPASANVYVSILGHRVQMTLRDTDEGRLYGRLVRLLEAHPLPEAPMREGPGACDTSGQGQDAPQEPMVHDAPVVDADPQVSGWCPIHTEQMIHSEKNGDEWWSHRIGPREDKAWCYGYGVGVKRPR